MPFPIIWCNWNPNLDPLRALLCLFNPSLLDFVVYSKIKPLEKYIGLYVHWPSLRNTKTSVGQVRKKQKSYISSLMSNWTMLALGHAVGATDRDHWLNLVTHPPGFRVTVTCPVQGWAVGTIPLQPLLHRWQEGTGLSLANQQSSWLDSEMCI